MRVGESAPKRLINYGVAVAAVPLSLSAQPVMASALDLPPRSHIRAGAASESGRWLDSEWAEMQSALAEILVHVPQSVVSIDEWYETSGDVAYPTPQRVEILDIQVIDDESSDAFRLPDPEFDVWTW